MKNLVSEVADELDYVYELCLMTDHKWKFVSFDGEDVVVEKCVHCDRERSIEV